MCIIFDWWHVRSTAHLLISLLAIIALTAGYEAVRAAAASYDAASSNSSNGSDHDSSMYTPTALPCPRPIPVPHRGRVICRCEARLVAFYPVLCTHDILRPRALLPGLPNGLSYSDADGDADDIHDSMQDHALIGSGVFRAGSWAGAGAGDANADSTRRRRMIKGMFYAGQVFYSFFIM